MENLWKSKTIDLGNIESNTKYEFSFETTKDATKFIKEVRPGCGVCTKVSDINSKGIKIKYSSGDVPIHLINDGVNINNTVYVDYFDGETDVLIFTGIMRN